MKIKQVKMIKELIIVLVFFLANLASILTAQTTTQMHVVGSAEFLPNELISNTIRDKNGEVCAGIMIVTDLSGLTYQSNNGIVDRQSQPGKDLLYVSPNERVIEIYKSGYEPLKIILTELSVNLRSGQVWQIRVTGDKINQEIGTGSFLINSIPDGAEISINGSVQKDPTPFSINNFPTGNYQISLKKNEYSDSSFSLQIKKDIYDTLIVELIPTFGFFNFRVMPTDAKVLLDGNNIIKSSIVKNNIGKYSYSIKLEHYYEEIGNIEITPGDTIFKDINLKPKMGFLTLIDQDSSAHGAEVIIDGIQKGNFPIPKFMIIEGDHNLLIKKEGFFSKNILIVIENEKELEVNISLAKTKKIKFVSIPSEANISIDNDDKGITPLEIFLTLGDHEVVFSKDGFADEELEITLSSKSNNEISVELIKEVEGKSSWLYWVGGALASGVAAAILLSPSSDKSTPTDLGRAEPPPRP